MDGTHNLTNPVVITLNEFRGGGHGLGVREQILDIRDTMSKSTVLQRAILLSVSEDLLDLRMGEDRFVVIDLVVLENIVLHSFIFLTFVVNIGNVGLFHRTRFFNCLSNQEKRNLLLVRCECIENILNSPTARNISVTNIRILDHVIIFGFLVSLGNLSQHIVKNILLRFRHTIKNIIHGLIRRSLSRGFSMRQNLILSILTRINNSLFLRTSIGMLKHYRFNGSTRIRGSKNKTNLLNFTMHDIVADLLKLICINAHRANIAMTNKLLGHLASIAFIEIAIGIHTLISIFENGVTKNIVDTSMLMLVDHRNLLAIITGKSSAPNRSTVGAKKIVLRCPATEIISRRHYSLTSLIISFV